MMFRKVKVMLLVLLILTGISQPGLAVFASTSQGSIYPGLDLKTIVKTSNTYTLSISTPYTKSEAINEAIFNWLVDQEHNFYQEIALYNDLNGNDVRHHLNIQLETKMLSQSAYYLVFSVYQFIGENSEVRHDQSVIVDIAGEGVYFLPSLINLQI